MVQKCSIGSWSLLKGDALNGISSIFAVLLSFIEVTLMRAGANPEKQNMVCYAAGVSTSFVQTT